MQSCKYVQRACFKKVFPYNVGMYIARVPNRSSPPAYLLRESYREGGKVKNRTLANLSHLPIEQIEPIRRVLKGEKLVAPGEAFSIQRSLPHGHVEVVLGMIRKLGVDRWLSRRRSRERDLVVAMIAQRLLFPCSKLATTRHWHSTTLAEELGVADADEEELYAALDWLLERQPSIEGRLAKEHLCEGALVLEMNLAEIESPEFPGERLVACFNPLLADERRRKREALLAATEKELAKLARQVARRTKRPMLQAEIALRAGRLVDRFKMAKHFELSIADGEFRFARRTESIERESQLDGIYVIRTSEPASGLSADDAVRDYKRLAEVKQAFRSLKSIDLLVRPIYHRTEEHVGAHIFVCLLAYYVQWHLKRAWAPLLFEDEELARDRVVRDPVASAEPSASAKRKKATHRTPDELPVHSFRTLIAELATRCRHTCVPAGGTPDVTFAKLTDVTPFQAEAFRLAGLKPADH